MKHAELIADLRGLADAFKALTSLMLIVPGLDIPLMVRIRSRKPPTHLSS